MTRSCLRAEKHTKVQKLKRGSICFAATEPQTGNKAASGRGDWFYLTLWAWSDTEICLSGLWLSCSESESLDSETQIGNSSRQNALHGLEVTHFNISWQREHGTLWKTPPSINQITLLVFTCVFVCSSPTYSDTSEFVNFEKHKAKTNNKHHKPFLFFFFCVSVYSLNYVGIKSCLSKTSTSQVV